MACYHPLTAIVTGVSKDTGKKIIEVIKRSSVPESWVESIKLPCGNCIGCREDRAKTWAIRCVHEASLYEKNCFITLTFCDGPHEGCEHIRVPVPDRVSLNKTYFPLFMKKLRKKYIPLCPRGLSKKKRQKWLDKNGIRFYHCGEYGEKFDRPHHHACIFNFDFPLQTKDHPDGKYSWKETKGGTLFRCGYLEKLWPYGYVSVGSVTFDSAAYVARYILKKINGEMAPGHYQGRQPEYTTMSRRPGIGKEWFKKYTESDISLAYREGFIVMNGKTYKIPKYYDQNYEIIEPHLYELVKENRQKKAKENPDNSRERLAVRKTVHQARNKMRSRSYES